MMAVLPDEIRMINTETKGVFSAYPCISPSGKFLFDPVKQAYKYRIRIPGVELSMIVVDVTDRQLREFMRTKTPIPVPHAR